VKCGAADRIVVDTDELSIPRTWPGRIYRLREAAKRLGLSVSVLKALKRSGIYEVKHRLPTRAGYHELDLIGFTQKLLALAPDQKTSYIKGEGTLTLQSVLCGRQDSVEIKLNVVRGLLSRSIAVYGSSHGTVGELLIYRAAYQQIVAGARSAAAGDTKNANEVAKLLSCSRDAIVGLVEIGALQARLTPLGLRTSPESIAAFSHEYASLSSIAKAKQSSSGAMMRCCQNRAIWMLLVPMPRQGPQPFIRRTDLGRLASA
jgi:hypothetical protein